MIRCFRRSLLGLATALTMLLPLALPTAVAFADCSNIGRQIGIGASQAAGTTEDLCSPTGTSITDIGALASKIVNIFSVIVGAVSVIMIIYGGFRYIISGGDSGRVGNAKNTLIYAVIGLIIVVLAQLIVHFVISFSSDSIIVQ